MAATNYTPIQLYYSTTASQAPTAGNLASGELAINITDGKLYYKDNGGVVQVIATKGAGTIGGSTTQIQYNNAGALAGSAAMVFNNSTNVVTLTTLNLTNALGATYGGTAQSSYTQGDLLYSSATNTLSKLGIGAVDYILTSTGSVPQWSAPSSISVLTATNLAGGLGGSVPYQSAVNTTTFLAIGAANRVMTSTGTAPQWVTSLTGLTGVSSSSITNTSLTSGRVVYSGASGVETDSSNLTFNGTTLSAGGLSTTGLSTLAQTVKIGDSNFSGVAVFAPATPAKLYVGTGTVTDTTSAIGATNATGAISSLAITPIAATNTSVTYTNAATLYIAGAPSAGTNVTLTNPYSLYVAAGTSYFGSNVGIGVTPSPWSTTTARAIQLGNVSSLSNYNNGIAASSAAILSQNSYYPTDGSPEVYLISGTGANKFAMVNGEARWYTAPAGTAGGNITFTQPMTLNSAGLLGLGSTNPTSRLYVVSSVATNTGGFVANFSTDSGDTARMGIYAYGSTYSGGTNFGLGANSVDIQAPAGLGISSGGTSPIVFGTNSTTEWARFTTPGNLGLGAPASSNWASQYRAIDIGINNIYASYWGSSNGDGGANTYGQLGLGQNLNGGDTFTGAGYASYYGQSGGRHSWWTSSAAGAAGGAITFVKAMTLNESRNLLIGTTAVGNNERLRVDSNGGDLNYNSAFTYSGTTNNAYCSTTWSHGQSGTAVGYIGVGGSATGNTAFRNSFVIGTQTASDLVFNTSDTDRMRLTAAGNFGIGVTPTVRFQVAGTAANGTPFIKYDVTSNNSPFNWVDTAFASNMTSGTNLISFIGQAASTNNAAYFGFKYSSSTSANNVATIGLYGTDNILNINGNGNVSLYNATTSANGIGITFPATQSASSDANCLDDYEEGTWTPSLSSEGGGSVATYNFVSGRYRKIGNVVIAWWGLNVNSWTNLGGTVLISGLPFTGISIGAYQEPVAQLSSGQWASAYAAYAGATYMFVGNGTTTMFGRFMNNVDTAMNPAAIQGGGAGVGTYMGGTMIYIATS